MRHSFDIARDCIGYELLLFREHYVLPSVTALAKRPMSFVQKDESNHRLQTIRNEMHLRLAFQAFVGTLNIHYTVELG